MADSHRSDRIPASARFGRVAVLLGGDSAEREISLRSGSMVLASLQRQGVDAHAFDPAKQSLGDLSAGRFDRAFVSLHGRFGEDGTIQGALEMMRIPYTGSGIQASAIAIDKIATKRIWTTHSLPTPPFTMLEGPDDGERAWRELAGACVVKPVREGSTLGLTKVMQASGMAEAYQLAAGFHDDVLAERLIVGRELTVAVLGAGPTAHALPIVEIRAPDGNYDYQNKYFTDSTEYLCPAPLSEALTVAIQQLSEQAYRALGCEGWGRVDLMLDAADQPWLLEVNTSPGMTDHSLVPMAARAAGLSYDELVLSVLATAALKVRGATGAPS